MGIREEIQRLAPSAVVELFEVHRHGTVTRFHAGTNALGGPVIWRGNEYAPWPIEAEGFERKTTGAESRPRLRVADVTGLMTGVSDDDDDLRGAEIRRVRTLARFLDAENFPDGNAEADPTQQFPVDVYFIDRKTRHVPGMLIEWEMVSSLDLQGAMLPRRQIIQNCCAWLYRSPECGYAGGPVADENDDATSDPARDACSKRLKGCELRYPGAPLPYGGFPAAGLVRA